MGILFFPISYLSEGIPLYPSTVQAAALVDAATKQLQKVSGNDAFSSTLHYKCFGCVSKEWSNVFVFTVVTDIAQYHVSLRPDSERQILLKHVIHIVRKLSQQWGITNSFRTSKFKDILCWCLPYIELHTLLQVHKNSKASKEERKDTRLIQ
jgi:hypothetical protein